MGKMKAGSLFFLFSLIFCLFFSVFVSFSHAAVGEDDVLELSQEQRDSVNVISDYFNRIRNLSGKFIQIGPSGRISEGKFALSKPGRLRFQYDDPNPIEIVSDGTWLMIRNRSSGIADYYPLGATPLNFVVSENIDILRDTVILDVSYSGGAVIVKLEDKGAFVSGQLLLVYDPRTESLQKWIIVDGAGRRTTISITEHIYNAPMDNALFFVPPIKEKENARDRGR